MPSDGLSFYGFNQSAIPLIMGVHTGLQRHL